MSPPDSGTGAPARTPAEPAAAKALNPTPTVQPTDDDDAAKAPRGPSMGDRLIAFTGQHFDVFRAKDGRVYGVRLDEPGRAYAHGAASSPLMAEIKSTFHAMYGKWPDSKASALASEFLTVQAGREPAREVALRSTWDRRRLLIDVGDDAWRVLQVNADGWGYLEHSPVPFKRSDVTAALADPADIGSLDSLWRLAAVAEPDRPLVLALLICAWLTGVAQPVVFITGPADAGKTEGARFLLSLVDPVTITERGGSLPAREEDWKARLTVSRCVFIDNASHVTAAGSDTLCKVATGGEAITRAHYTNDTPHITDMQAPVWLTSIGVGALRGDLGSRMLRVELTAMDPERRLVLSDLREAQDEARPGITRALLDLTVEVLRLLPIIDRTRLTHRLTDFELVVRCIDKVLGTEGATRLGQVADELAGDVLDADPVAQALLRGIESPTTSPGPVLGEHTAMELLRTLTWHADALRLSGQTWPRTPKVLSEHLQRIAPALTSHGITVTWRRTKAARLVTITQTEQAS